MAVTTHSLTNFVSYNYFSSKHMAFLSTLPQHHDPTTYSQAACHSHWPEAMAFELQALESNNIWTLQALPLGKKPIGCKWIFKTKIWANGSIERHKARLVAKVYTQIEGLDYPDTFAPIAKLVIGRCVLTIAAIFHWSLHQFDVHNTFLHGELDEEVYMQLPPGYPK